MFCVINLNQRKTVSIFQSSIQPHLSTFTRRVDHFSSHEAAVDGGSSAAAGVTELGSLAFGSSGFEEPAVVLDSADCWMVVELGSEAGASQGTVEVWSDAEEQPTDILVNELLYI